MEIKIIRKMDHLPRVFLTPDLNKFALTENVVNCGKYVSRSGATFSGCGKIVVRNKKFDINTLKEERGIYFTPHEPLVSISYRQKALLNTEDLKQILGNVDLTNVSPNNDVLLIKYTNYKIEVYDIFYKGRMYEFPVLETQGRLTIYQVPEPQDVYKITYSSGTEIKEFNRDLFEEITEFTIYNHKVTFANPQLSYKSLYVYGGDGDLIYIQSPTAIKLEASDHENKKFVVHGNTWLLFSHPRPRRFQD